MTAPTEFEKRLIELNLTYAQIELVKQAVKEFYVPRIVTSKIYLDEFENHLPVGLAGVDWQTVKGPVHLTVEYIDEPQVIAVRVK